MSAITLDTSAYSNFKRGKGNLKERIAQASRIIMPVPVLAELRIGFRAGSKEEKNLQELEVFLSNPRVTISGINEHTAILFSEIYTFLKKKGKPIPINDVWIAATAMEHGSILLSDDQHFSEVGGLLLNIS